MKNVVLTIASVIAMSAPSLSLANQNYTSCQQDVQTSIAKYNEKKQLADLYFRQGYITAENLKASKHTLALYKKSIQLLQEFCETEK